MNTKLAEMEAKLVRWVFLVMLGNVALSLAATRAAHGRPLSSSVRSACPSRSLACCVVR
jgi:hypothetical protein